MSKCSATLASPFMTYFSLLEARQTEQRARYITHPQHARYITHTHTHSTHHLLLWISSHERPKNLLLGLLGTIKEGISYVCLCVCMGACVFVCGVCVFSGEVVLNCVCACMRQCRLVGTDLGLFGPVGFVVVFETRVNVSSAFPLQVNNPDVPWSNSGMETFRVCYVCHLCFSPICVLTLKCFHAHWLFVGMMTKLIL